MNKHTIFAFVGASGSGKSTLIIELLNFFPHLAIIKSTSTRPRRDETDDLFYKLVDSAYILDPINQGNFLSRMEYAGNHYVYEKNLLDEILGSRCGMFAITEPAIPVIISHGYNMKLIKVVPDRDWHLERTIARRKDDLEREANHPVEFDLVLKNSFKPGGLDASVELLSEFIASHISAHAPVRI